MILPIVLIPSFSEIFHSDPKVVEWSNGKSKQAEEGTASADSFPEAVIVAGVVHERSN